MMTPKVEFSTLASAMLLNLYWKCKVWKTWHAQSMLSEQQKEPFYFKNKSNF